MLAAIAPVTQQARAETFRQALDRVSSEHPRLASARFLTSAGKADVAAARSAYWPQFGIETDAGLVDGNSTRASGFAFLPEAKVSQLVYDGGRTPSEIRRRKLRVSLLNVQEEAALSDIASELAQAWIDHDRAGELASISEQQVTALTALNDLVVEIAGFDRGRQSDVVMVSSRLEQALTTLQTRRISLAEARARIREIAAYPIEPTGPVPNIAGVLPGSVGECQALVEGSPRLRIADIAVQESSETVRGARNWWAPQLAVEGARTSERTALGDTRLFNGFGLRLRATALPFDSGGGRARHRSAQAALAATQSDLTLVRTSLNDQALRLWTFQSQRADRLPALEGLVGKADEARAIVFEQFGIGRRSILDVLAYDLERFNVRAQLVNERFDIAQIRYQLMGSLGRIYPAISAPSDRPAVTELDR